MQLKEWDLVYVRAIDHTSKESEEWLPIKSAQNETPCEIHAVGFVISWDDKVLRIANTHVDKSSVGILWMIPRGCIQEIRVLRASKGQPKL